MNTQAQATNNDLSNEAIVYMNTGSFSSKMNILNTQPGINSVEPSVNDPSLIEVRFDPGQTRSNHIVKSISEDSKRWTCITFMYCKGGDSATFAERVVKNVTSLPGVLAAERSKIKGYVFMVHFDLRKIRASQIVNSLKQQGYTALLFGC